MKTNIKATGVELTNALSSYVNEKLGYLDKLTTKYQDTQANVEIGKTTKHHKSGEFFFAEINLHVDGKVLREKVHDEDLYAAIDLMKDTIAISVDNYNKKKNTMVRRGARAFKDFLRGFYRGRKKNKINLFF